MLMRAYFFIFFACIFSLTSHSEMIKVRTNDNKTISLDVDLIKKSPEGYLTSVIKHQGAIKTTEKDGSIFVDVGSKAINIIKNLMRNRRTEIPSSMQIREDLLYLYPNFFDDFKKRIVEKLWYCSAYCYTAPFSTSKWLYWNAYSFLVEENKNIEMAWQQLNNACQAKTGSSISNRTLTKAIAVMNFDLHRHLPSMNDSCVRRLPDRR